MSTETQTKLTYEDYLSIPDDGRRHEIIDGEHYVNPAPNVRHQLVVGNLHLALATYVRARKAGKVMLSPFDVLFDDYNVVEPDVLYISAGRVHILENGKYSAGAPDLAIEVLSPTSRRHDEIIKRRLYERFGVVEYWIVDPELETVKIYRRGDAGFVRVAELSNETGDVLTSPLFPELQLPLVEIFEL